jgi:hypothetical protein
MAGKEQNKFCAEAFNTASVQRVSEIEKLEFFLSMIEELKDVAEHAGLRALSLQLSIALEGLKDAENRRKAKLRSLC